jgi:hypothetical protein
MSCRDEILDCARAIIEHKGENEFTIEDILTCLRRHGTKYTNSTIRTHVTSRLCANAPDHHAITYSDLERTGRGTYRLRGITLTAIVSTEQTINNARLRGMIVPASEILTKEKMTLSNTERGRQFQQRSGKALELALGCELRLEVGLAIPPRKLHVFDLADDERTIVAECKAVGWRTTGNVPSAKITHLREAVQYLHDLTNVAVRCLIISKSCHARRKESLASYFVRLNKDYLDDINVFELGEDSNELFCLHGRPVEVLNAIRGTSSPMRSTE